MESSTAVIYALDFDGVICDSVIELSLSGWKAAQTIWSDMSSASLSEYHTEQFRQVRPALETGYEAILVMRLLHNGISATDLYKNYDHSISTLIKTEQLDITRLKKIYGDTRDQWIQQDETDWLDHNPLFTGIAERLHHLSDKVWYIITTKQERFVKLILQASHIEISGDRIFGIERQMSKQEVLQQLLIKHPEQTILFIEDRLPTLLGITKNPALQPISLQLVDWGYNTMADREIALQKGIEIINKAQLLK